MSDLKYPEFGEKPLVWTKYGHIPQDELVMVHQWVDEGRVVAWKDGGTAEIGPPRPGGALAIHKAWFLKATGEFVKNEFDLLARESIQAMGAEQAVMT